MSGSIVYDGAAASANGAAEQGSGPLSGSRIRLREVIIVEGRYDKHTLAGLVESPIITLEGFSVFHDREKLAYLRLLAERRGLVVLTDSDGAGFVLRNYLKGAIPAGQVKHAYIPEVPGRERRKRRSGKAGLLGVEGMPPSVLLDALRRAGAVFLDAPETCPAAESGMETKRESGAVGSGTEAEREFISADSDMKAGREPITKADLFSWGLTGQPDSAKRRRALLTRLSLPEKLGTNAMLEALNLCYRREEIAALLRDEKRGRDTE